MATLYPALKPAKTSRGSEGPRPSLSGPENHAVPSQPLPAQSRPEAQSRSPVFTNSLVWVDTNTSNAGPRGMSHAVRESFRKRDWRVKQRLHTFSARRQLGDLKWSRKSPRPSHATRVHDGHESSTGEPYPVIGPALSRVSQDSEESQVARELRGEEPTLQDEGPPLSKAQHKEEDRSAAKHLQKLHGPQSAGEPARMGRTESAREGLNIQGAHHTRELGPPEKSSTRRAARLVKATKLASAQEPRRLYASRNNRLRRHHATGSPEVLYADREDVDQEFTTRDRLRVLDNRTRPALRASVSCDHQTMLHPDTIDPFNNLPVRVNSKVREVIYHCKHSITCSLASMNLRVFSVM